MVMPSLLSRLIIPYFYPCPKPSITIPAGSQVSTHSVLLQNFSPLDEQGLEYYKGGDDERRYYTRFEPVIYNLINGNTRFTTLLMGTQGLNSWSTTLLMITQGLNLWPTTLLMRTQSLNPWPTTLLMTYNLLKMEHKAWTVRNNCTIPWSCPWYGLSHTSM